MNTLDFSKFRFIAGVRVEGTNLDTLSWQDGCTDPDPAICPTIIQPGQNFIGGGGYVKKLSSPSLPVALSKKTHIPLVFSRGVSPPKPPDVSPAFFITPAQGGK